GLSSNTVQSTEIISDDGEAVDQKWCPQCGTVNKLVANVCIQCGHRFRTQLEGQGSGQSEATPHTEIVEPPITQNAESPLVLPPEITPPAETILPPSRAPNLEGEPAPDLSSDQLDSLREQSSDNADPYERLKRSLQRKRRKP